MDNCFLVISYPTKRAAFAGKALITATSIPAKKPLMPLVLRISLEISIILMLSFEVWMLDLTVSGAIDTIQPTWPAKPPAKKYIEGSGKSV